METIQIIFLGLIMFTGLGERPGRQVLIPIVQREMDIPSKGDKVEPHVASVIAPEKDVASCEGCRSQGNDLLLDLHGDSIVIEGLGGDFVADSSHATLIPHLEEVCPQFRLRAPLPADVSTLEITRGTLTGRKGPGHHVRESVLTATKTGTVRISVTDNGCTRTMELKPSAKTLTISNRFADHPNGKEPRKENHWLAYYSLAASRVPATCDVPKEKDPRHPGQETTIACSNSNYP